MRRVIVMLLLLAATTAANAATVHQTVDRTLNVGAAATFELENTNGRVTVTAWDQPRIRIVADKSVRRSDAQKAQEALAKVVVDIRQRGDAVSVRTILPHNGGGFWDHLFSFGDEGEVVYQISVPRTATVHVETTNGSVHVTGIDGSVKAETTNGEIELARCGGPADATTTNGRIRADLLRIASAGRFETTNGSIEITIPAAAKADVQAETTNGGIESDLPVATRSAGKNEMRGTINGGGPLLKLETTNGSIRIRKAA